MECGVWSVDAGSHLPGRSLVAHVGGLLRFGERGEDEALGEREPSEETDHWRYEDIGDHNVHDARDLQVWWRVGAG